MKHLFSLLFVSSIAAAGAELQVRPKFHLGQQKPGVETGMSMTQTVLPGMVNIRTWFGFGIGPDQYKMPVLFADASLKLDMLLSEKFIMSPGITLKYSDKFEHRDNFISLNLSYKLW